VLRGTERTVGEEPKKNPKKSQGKRYSQNGKKKKKAEADRGGGVRRGFSNGGRENHSQPQFVS